MAVTPAFWVIGAAVVPGAWLLFQYLAGRRNDRVLVALHFILALAMLSGLLVPLIAKPRPGAIGLSIAVHTSIATLGFGLVLLFALA